MEPVNIYDAKTRLSQLVDKAAGGEDVVVCRNGKPLVRITALVVDKQRIRFGVLKGKVKIAPDFDAPLPQDVLAGFKVADVRLLLDTHVFLWAVAGSRQLTPTLRTLIQGAEQVFVSAASIWEIAIKVRLGKLEADPVAMVGAIEESGFHELPVRAFHAAQVANLPLHHSDPFDRLLVAQALSEPLRLLTADSVLAPYSELVMLCRR